MIIIIIGKRTGSGPGPGRPPKYPNLNTNSPSEEPTSTLGTNANTSASGSTGGGLVDILNQLDSSKRNEMLALVGQYKARVLGLNDFMMRARELLGERLYGQLARDMSNAAAARNAVTNTASGNIPTMPTMPTMSAMPTIPNMPVPMMQLPPNMRPQNVGSMPMHSMPQIYGQGSAINISTMPQSSQYTQQQQLQQAQNPMEVDVTKMDTSSLQDVMQYSGVDLKAEAELLYRENSDINQSSGSLYVDHRLKFDYFFNPFKFRAIVQHALQRQFFSSTLNNNNSSSGSSSNNESSSTATAASGKVNKPLGISEEAVHLLGIAIQKRLIGIIRKLSEISKHRVDYGRGRFKIKIENDPKKQLWLQEKLFIEGVGEDKRRPGTTATTNNNNTTASTPSTTTALNGTNQTLLNPPSLASIQANKPAVPAKPTPSTSTSVSTSGTGTDDSVKTKLANVTAMAALGIRQKSWMSSATSMGTNTSGASTSSNQSSSQTTTNNEEKEPEVYQHPLANFYSLPSSTPLTDSELKAQYFNRTISTVDLITCMETDSHLKRSRLLAVLYESLPRENKENNPQE